jgi:hypothetical protein
MSPDEHENGSGRDPKATPHPGDRFRCRSGIELQVTGAVISISKNGHEIQSLYVNRFVRGQTRRTGLSTATLKYQIKNAEILAKGSDLDPWTNAQRRPACEVFGRNIAEPKGKDKERR